MKKIILSIFLFLIVIISIGCNKKQEKTPEYLLNLYVKAYMDAEPNLVKEIFPPFYVEYSKEYMTKERLDSNLNEDKNNYGDDFKITFDLKGKKSFTEEELDKLNKNVEDTYKTSDKAEECFALVGEITYKGSKKEDIGDLSSMGYCKYSNEWYLVRLN